MDNLGLYGFAIVVLGIILGFVLAVVTKDLLLSGSVGTCFIIIGGIMILMDTPDTAGYP